jgi:hypothetical protein
MIFQEFADFRIDSYIKSTAAFIFFLLSQQMILISCQDQGPLLLHDRSLILLAFYAVIDEVSG